MSEWIVDINERDFEREVVERSKTVPVVVDFWAPWCGPCRTLGPLLERLATEHEGAFVVAKVNVDENPNLASAAGAQSIPMVLGLRGGEVVAEFVGAQPEAQVREFLARLLPSEGELIATDADALRAAGKLAEAEAAYRRALETEPRCDRALVGLAALLAERGEDAEAVTLIDRVAPGTPWRQDADRLAAAIRVRQAGAVDVGALQAKVDANPTDVAARFELAQALAARTDYEAALQHYLEIVSRDRSFRDDGARKAMLDIFELLGAAHETTQRYRSELGKVLFR